MRLYVKTERTLKKKYFKTKADLKVKENAKITRKNIKLKNISKVFLGSNSQNFMFVTVKSNNF